MGPPGASRWGGVEGACLARIPDDYIAKLAVCSHPVPKWPHSRSPCATVCDTASAMAKAASIQLLEDMMFRVLNLWTAECAKYKLVRVQGGLATAGSN